MSQLPDEDDTPFSLPRDIPEVMPIDYPQTDSNIDMHEAYDEGIDDSVEDDPYRPDDDPIDSVKRSMKTGMMGKLRLTTDHDIIRRWVERRGGQPATVKDAEDGLDGEGLRIDFQDGEHDEAVVPISWNKFFTLLDEHQLAFVYESKTSSGAESRLFRFVRRPLKTDEL